MPTTSRSFLFLALLLALGLVATGCLTGRGGGRGGGGGDDDDDSAADDDDGAEDDDDAVQDDDDAGDDDDVQPDDDDVQPDDDDAGEQGYADMSLTDYYLETAVDTTATTTVTLSNLSGSVLTGSVIVDNTSGWSLSTGSSVTLYGFETTTRTLTFAPWFADSWSTQVVFSHDGSNTSPLTVTVDGYSFDDIPTYETDCTDGIDNDADGYLDCIDFDCNGDPACPVEDCSNGTDDDGDGYVDCDDYDCSADPACTGGAEICDDLIDNDSDGELDCFDTDCAGDAACSSADMCCFYNGDGATWNLCQDSTAISCVCAMDSFCCDGSGWDSLCQGEYINDCSASTCGP